MKITPNFVEFGTWIQQFNKVGEGYLVQGEDTYPHRVFTSLSSRIKPITWYGYTNPHADDLIDQGAATFDDAKRSAIYKEHQPDHSRRGRLAVPVQQPGHVRDPRARQGVRPQRGGLLLREGREPWLTRASRPSPGRTSPRGSRSPSTSRPCPPRTGVPALLEQCQLDSAAVARLKASGARFGAIVTEPWCFDSLHALPLLVRMQEAVPELELRAWQRSASPDLALRIAGGHPGGALPSVPHVAFYDAQFAPLGHFQRPASISAWLDETSRDFRTQLRLTERDRVRRETLDGLLGAAEERPTTPAPATAGRTLTVYEQWVATNRPARPNWRTPCAATCPALLTVPGVRSVDFAAVDDGSGRYLALFRYEDDSVRDRFLGSDAVKQMRAEVDPLWRRVTDTTWSYGL